MSTTFASAALFVRSNADDIGRMQADLSESERCRYAKLRRSRQARQYLGSRWLLRQHLATEMGVAPEQVPVAHGDNQAPKVFGLGHRIGLSHSHDACLCIVAAHVDAGCDIEHMRPRRHDIGAIAAHYFHPLETAALARADGYRRLNDFYRLWTLKEAGRKAVGQGIAHGLKTPAFSLSPTLECTTPAALGPWTFAVRELTIFGASYALALTIRAPADNIALYRYQPGTARRLLKAPWSLTVTS